ncbi:hypothetical protein [Photobacterium profundum]|uniref:Uncharacterized protein n=1 Tax=Photobacterium profundum (strain SS9) TaxID=298386 RepID=Q6LTT5_PHOPR|nr:hypothetical protein [Photobacterium profundum]CAG19290.1 hypothetical protein PBPRA0878 [Photobacterium profundum SS9]
MQISKIQDKLHTSFHGIFQEPDGQSLLSFLLEPESILRSETAIYLGKAPLDALTPGLLQLPIFANQHEDDETKQRIERLKQLAGSLTRIIMEERGYELNPSKQKLKPSTEEKPQLFVKVSTYSKAKAK